MARVWLAYGERLRRRRAQLNAADEIFERLRARGSRVDRASTERSTGQTNRVQVTASRAV